MKRYTLNINKTDSISLLPLVEDERGEWVWYEEALKEIDKAFKKGEEAWNIKMKDENPVAMCFQVINEDDKQGELNALYVIQQVFDSFLIEGDTAAQRRVAKYFNEKYDETI